MRHRTRAFLATAAAASILLAAVGTASARRLEFSSSSFRVVWNSVASEKLEFSATGLSVTCAVTLEGTLHSRTISKVSGQLIGNVTRAFVAQPSCEGGREIILNGIETLPNTTTAPETLPWHVRYNSFNGTLPTITGVTVQFIGVSFLIETLFLLTCLYRSTEAMPVFAIFNLAAGGAITGLRADETKSIPRVPGTPLECPATGRLARTGKVTVLGAATAITIHLVA